MASSAIENLKLQSENKPQAVIRLIQSYPRTRQKVCRKRERGKARLFSDEYCYDCKRQICSIVNESSRFNFSLAHFLIHLQILFEFGVLLNVESHQNCLTLLTLRKSVLFVLSLFMVTLLDWFFFVPFTTAISLPVDGLEISPYAVGYPGNLLPVLAKKGFMLYKFLFQDEVEGVVSAP